jgi:hypothetical protein
MPDILTQLAEALAALQHKKDTGPTGTPSTPYYTGPGGLFGVMGLERDVLSTRVQPRGLAGAIPARATNTLYPRFPYVTGFVKGSGTNPDGVCDDGPIAGAGKACIQTADFGRYTQMTRELEINRIGQQINRGEFQDLVIMNDPLLNDQGIVPGVPTNPALAREVLMRFMEVGIAFQNQLMPQLWIGNPANDSVNGGYAEFPGLDILVGTTKIDAITGAACPSLASDVKDFAYKTVDGAADELVNALVYMCRYLKWNAERMNMLPVTWSIVMRPTLFYEVTAVWPCSYMSYRCKTSNDVVASVDAGDMVAMRDNMRNELYLMIDGERWNVVLDDAIPEDTSTNNANVPESYFSSDIYVIPRTYLGGNVATFWEFFDYTSAMTGATDGQLGSDYWTDSGRFLWHKKPPVNWCVQWIAKVEPRIILRTPHLAGRLNNVMYAPLQQMRQAFPDDPYFVDGGVSAGYTETAQPYSEWNPLQ